MYFNPNTLSLDYSRGKEGTEVSDRSIISWKQIHLPGLKGVALTERDHVEYALFAKMIREEVRVSATAIIEAKYMEISVDMLGGVKNVPKSSDFRKLRSVLNARAAELLVQEKEDPLQSLMNIWKINGSKRCYIATSSSFRQRI
jgi:hypothetical protein